MCALKRYAVQYLKISSIDMDFIDFLYPVNLYLHSHIFIYIDLSKKHLRDLQFFSSHEWKALCAYQNERL